MAYTYKRGPVKMGMENYLAKLKWSTFFITSAGLMLALASISPAYAAPPTAVSGSFNFTVTGVTSVTTSDGNTFTSFTFSEILTGDVSGTRTGTGTFITHPDGTLNVRDCGTFVGSILGNSGTANDCANAQGTSASATGQFVDTQGTGGLAGGHAEGFFVGGATGPTTFAGTYSGEFHFGP